MNDSGFNAAEMKKERKLWTKILKKICCDCFVGAVSDLQRYTVEISTTAKARLRTGLRCVWVLRYRLLP